MLLDDRNRSHLWAPTATESAENDASCNCGVSFSQKNIDLNQLMSWAINNYNQGKHMLTEIFKATSVFIAGSFQS